MAAKSGLNTRNLTHGSLSLKDGQTAPNTLAISLDSGDLSFTRSRSHVTVLNRGDLDHQSRGKATPCQVNFSIPFTEYGSRTTQAVVAASAGGAVTGYSVKDFLLNTGALLTSGNGRTDVFSTDLTFVVANPAASGDEAETLVFTDFVCDDVSFSEGEETNMVTFSGTALVEEPTSARA